jgi:membrane protease YdiL (CAAX protease family)
LVGVVVVSAVGSIALALVGAAPQADDPVGAAAASAVLTALGGLAAALVLARWKAGLRGDVRAADFALVRPKPALPKVIAGTAVLAVVLAVAQAAYKALAEPTEQITEVLRVADGAALVMLGAAAVCLAPVVEELLWRGVFYRALRSRCRPAVAAPIAAVVFAALHMEVEMMPVLAVGGLVFCLVLERTGSLFPVIMLHSTLNAVELAQHHLLLAVTLWAVMTGGCLLAIARSSTRTHPAQPAPLEPAAPQEEQ